ncbi:MAG: phosphate ABC transporter permease family protein [Burkholderiaceae bacterium]
MSSVGYYLGRRRAFTVARGKLRTLHSLPGYYGLYVAIWCALPALLIVGAWSALEGSVVTNLVVSSLPEELRSLGPDRLNLVVNDIRNLVTGNIVSGEPSPAIRAAAEHCRALQSFSHASQFVLAIVVGLIGAAITLTRTHPKQRARNAVESVATWVLIACSGVAILTTIRIVLSVLFESVRKFFRAVPIHPSSCSG